MNKVGFLPVSIASGFVAGWIGKKLLGLIWGLVDDQEPPSPEHRRISVGKLALALTLEGALSALLKGLVDHGSRHAYRRMVGTWPGDEIPEPE